ncbi:MAG: type II toxin-antitoxin system RelE/ParE family toxin [Acidimicrobiales bacterium]
MHGLGGREPEVTDWYLGLSADDRDVAAERIDLLVNLGHMMRMPHSRQLGNGLLELRFDMSRRSWRITYWHRPDGGDRPTHGVPQAAEQRGQGGRPST